MFLDDIFWLSIAIIFATGIAGAVIRTRQRDRCLRLFQGQDVTATLVDGRSVWGDLGVFAKGLELRYPQQHCSSNGLLKTSWILDDLSKLAAICRFVGNLSAEEVAKRQRQVSKRFRPGPWRRSLRGLRNLVNTIRDAFHQAIGAFVGQLSKGTKVIGGQRSQVTDVGKSLIGAAGQAYEPLLEAHIGKPVVIEMQRPGETGTRFELAGYLAEYTADYLALFNVEHQIADTQVITANGEQAPTGHELEGNQLRNSGDMPLVVERIDGTSSRPVGALLLPGATSRLAEFSGTATATVLQVPRIDLVCSRKVARVSHAGAK